MGQAGMTGEVVAIHIARSAGAPMQEMTAIEAVTGEGLVGDRYRVGIGFYSATPTDPGARELTLIEAESLDAVRDETGINLDPSEHRRNITTRAIALQPLIGQRFRIGEIICEGVRNCPPCNHLEDVTGKQVMKPLIHRGGIRARIVEGGWIRTGDPIQQLEPS
jgi:MOSC domain-containing protein YiiM